MTGRTQTLPRHDVLDEQRHRMKMARKKALRRHARPSFRFPSKACFKSGCPKPWTQEREAERRRVRALRNAGDYA